jgi:hypothetical protein
MQRLPALKETGSLPLPIIERVDAAFATGSTVSLIGLSNCLFNTLKEALKGTGSKRAY